MPVFAGLFVSIFSGLVSFFVQWFSKKLALGITAVTVFMGLTLALWGAIGLGLSSIVALLPGDSGLLTGLWVATPPNAQACIAATIAADTAVALYRWNVENLRLMAYIT